MDNTQSIWLAIWQLKLPLIVITLVYLSLVLTLTITRAILLKRGAILTPVKYIAVLFAFTFMGLYLKAQPTTTNILILLNGLKDGQFPIELYLLEPFLFISFIFIAVTMILWGRGVFCGWLCPYGALLEILNIIYDKIPFKKRFTLPLKVHSRLIYLKYAALVVITSVSLFYSFMASEYMTEVEPFKTFVLKLDRDWYFVLYFVLLTIISVLIYRAFCTYLCPLGAAISIPSLKWLPLIKLRRYGLCGKCTICMKDCKIGAIGQDGSIRYTECLACLECQKNYLDKDRCPALKKYIKNGLVIGISIITFTFAATPRDACAKTLLVGRDYPSIDSALSKAVDGDTIEVDGGVYNGNIVIKKSVRLIGKNSPLLTAKDGWIIDVAGRDITVEGFRLNFEHAVVGTLPTAVYVEKGASHVVIRNNVVTGAMVGFWVVEAKDVRIENNTVTGRKEIDQNDRGNCVTLTGSQFVTVNTNKFTDCRDGIYMEATHDSNITNNDITKSRFSIHTMWVDRCKFNGNVVTDNLVGIAIMYTKHSEVKNNTTVGNSTSGLLLNQAVRSEISGNSIIGNTKGIFFYNSVFNKMTSNLVMNNNLGLHCWGGSVDNEISGNSFIANEIQVKFVAAKNQVWNGNYWSDYIGWDMKKNGYGDTPYESNSVVDQLFWRYPVSKILFSSPALHVLVLLDKQFPIIKTPRVVDNKPYMKPLHPEWSRLKERYAMYQPQKYYGEMEKLPHLSEGGF